MGTGKNLLLNIDAHFQKQLLRFFTKGIENGKGLSELKTLVTGKAASELQTLSLTPDNINLRKNELPSDLLPKADLLIASFASRIQNSRLSFSLQELIFFGVFSGEYEEKAIELFEAAKEITLRGVQKKEVGIETQLKHMSMRFNEMLEYAKDHRGIIRINAAEVKDVIVGFDKALAAIAKNLEPKKPLSESKPRVKALLKAFRAGEDVNITLQEAQRWGVLTDGQVEQVRSSVSNIFLDKEMNPKVGPSIIAEKTSQETTVNLTSPLVNEPQDMTLGVDSTEITADNSLIPATKITTAPQLKEPYMDTVINNAPDLKEKSELYQLAEENLANVTKWVKGEPLTKDDIERDGLDTKEREAEIALINQENLYAETKAGENSVPEDSSGNHPDFMKIIVQSNDDFDSAVGSTKEQTKANLNIESTVKHDEAPDLKTSDTLISVKNDEGFPIQMYEAKPEDWEVLNDTSDNTIPATQVQENSPIEVFEESNERLEITVSYDVPPIHIESDIKLSESDDQGIEWEEFMSSGKPESSPYVPTIIENKWQGPLEKTREHSSRPVEKEHTPALTTNTNSEIANNQKNTVNDSNVFGAIYSKEKLEEIHKQLASEIPKDFVSKMIESKKEVLPIKSAKEYIVVEDMDSIKSYDKLLAPFFAKDVEPYKIWSLESTSLYTQPSIEAITSGSIEDQLKEIEELDIEQGLKEIKGGVIDQMFNPDLSDTEALELSKLYNELERNGTIGKEVTFDLEFQPESPEMGDISNDSFDRFDYAKIS